MRGFRGEDCLGGGMSDVFKCFWQDCLPGVLDLWFACMLDEEDVWVAM